MAGTLYKQARYQPVQNALTQLQAFWSMTSTTYVGGMTVVTDAQLSNKSKHVHLKLGKGIDINQASKTADIIQQ